MSLCHVEQTNDTKSQNVTIEQTYQVLHYAHSSDKVSAKGNSKSHGIIWIICNRKIMNNARRWVWPHSSSARTGMTKPAEAKKSRACWVTQLKELTQLDTTTKKLMSPRNGPHVSLGRKLKNRKITITQPFTPPSITRTPLSHGTL